MKTPAQNDCARRGSVVRCRRFEQGAEWGGNRASGSLSGHRGTDGEGLPRIWRARVSKVDFGCWVGASESVSRNQL